VGLCARRFSGFERPAWAAADAIDGNGQPSEPHERFEAAMASSDGGTADADAPAARAAVMELDSDGVCMDARSSTVLLRELPGLATALDMVAMRANLQGALVGNASIVERCTLGKALYLPTEGCILRYELEIRGDNGSCGRYIVGARLFPDRSTSARFFGARLLPLAQLARGRAELAPFMTPICELQPLPMVAYAFPIDPELPTLVGATDPERVRGLFRFHVEPSGYSVPADSCRVELVHYPRRARCVLRYELEGRLRSGMQARRTVYGRVMAESPSTGVAAAALAELGRRARFRVPRLLAFRRELGLALVEAIPGVPLIPQLVAPRADAPPVAHTTLALEEAVDACAHIAAGLHAAGIDADVSRSLDDDLDELRAAVSSLRRISPVLGEQLAAWLEQLCVDAASSHPLPPVFCHGDYTPGQVVFDGTERGLLDLDTLCQAEAALDLGHFSAYLRVACGKAVRKSSFPSTLGSELTERFLQSYVDAAGIPIDEEAHLLGRVRAYETASLVRMAVHSWQQLKPVRTADVLSVLEESVGSAAASR
jgi:hypothetical protein